MNQDQFIKALEQPGLIADLDESTLREIVETFPFFKEAQLMLTKLMHEKKHLHFHRQLKLAALYANNREKLYELLYRQQLIQTIDELDQSAQEETIKKQEQSSDQQTSQTNDLSPVEDSKIEGGMLSENDEETEFTVPSENEEDAAFIQPIPITQLTFQSTEESSTATTPKERESNDPTEKPQDLGLLEKEILSHAFSLESSYERISAEENKEESTPTEKKQINQQEPLHNEVKSLNDWLHQQTAARAEKKENKRERTQELIDSFIEKDPQIQRSDQMDFNNPVDAARMSIVDSEEFVTETLAKIYANQGNKEKAISVYNKLMLKYPLKKTYFAGLIEKLKN